MSRVDRVIFVGIRLKNIQTDVRCCVNLNTISVKNKGYAIKIRFLGLQEIFPVSSHECDGDISEPA